MTDSKNSRSSKQRASSKTQNSAEKKVAKKINEGYVKKGAKKVTEEDLNEVLEKEREIRQKFEKGGPLGRFIEDVKLLFSLLRDYWEGNYREIPWLTIAAVVFTLLYVLSPIDLIPDFIPIIGYVDDALVVAVCLRFIEQDLHTYKEWKIEKAQSET